MVAKSGTSGWSLSSGIRVFPLHGYLQTGVPTSRCNRDLSERKERRLARKGKTAADIKCSEWVFSLEISMLGLHEWLPSIKGTLTEAEYANRWYGLLGPFHGLDHGRTPLVVLIKHLHFTIRGAFHPRA